MMDWIINGMRGLCMALADSVPGVSGGTIAFILGFYDKFINSLNDLMFGKWPERKAAIIFLIKLGIGWAIGMVLAVLLLTNLFETHIYETSSLFLGFVLFAILLIMRDEKEILPRKFGKRGKLVNLLFMLLGAVVVMLITYFNPISGAETAVNIADLNIGMILYIFVAGMVAISAMVLPGISGSTLLLIFGLYMPVMTAVKQVLRFEFSSLPAVIIFGLGVIAGIVLVIRLVKLALSKYRSQTICCIIGLMIGSLYAIIMGPTTLGNNEPLMLETFNIWMFLLGGAVVVGLEFVKRKLVDKNSSKIEKATEAREDK